jgi:hypothetical protein
MQIHLFDLKSEMKREGIMVMDFLENNFKISYSDSNLQIAKVMLIEDRHICRPDLISYDSYNSVDYVDMILKFNQISNPFSMELYDFIVIPTLASGLKFYRQEKLTQTQAIIDTKALFLDPTKASQKDIARIAQLQKIANKRVNGASEIKPTNLLRNGEVPYKTDGENILFAPSMSSTGKFTQTTN